jgi:hypothetical protein
VKDVEMAWGTMEHLPPWHEIPDEFRRETSPWCSQISRWFAIGGDRAWWDRLVPRPGVEKSAAARCLKALLSSWAPKHEHKIAGVAYLCSLWFDDPELASAPAPEAP